MSPVSKAYDAETARLLAARMAEEDLGDENDEEREAREKRERDREEEGAVSRYEDKIARLDREGW